MKIPATRRAVLGALSAAPLAAAPVASVALAGAAAPALSDLARACVAHVERLAWLDQPENVGGMSEEAWDAEFSRDGAVFRRAIDEPSSGASDIAAKARLMLSDLDRFKPADQYPGTDLQLMRVILREAIAMGGQA